MIHQVAPALWIEAYVKNTFSELPSDEDEPPRLRTVHTAQRSEAFPFNL